MKKLSVLIGSLFILGSVSTVSAELNEAQLERIVAAVSSQYDSPETQFFVELVQLPLRARKCMIEDASEQKTGVTLQTYLVADAQNSSAQIQSVAREQEVPQANCLDEDGILEGVVPFVQTYLRAIEGHSDLYALELYSRMDRQFLVSNSPRRRTLDKYVHYALNKKLKRSKDANQKELLHLLQATMNEKKAQYKKYDQLVQTVVQTRADLQEIKIDAPVVQGAIHNSKVSDAQNQQVLKAFGVLKDLTDLLLKTDDEALAFVAQGLKQDPLVTQNAVKMDLAVFLKRMGMRHTMQNEATQLVSLGERVQRLAEQELASN